MESWVIEEMGGVDLKDKRRNRRACQVLNAFGAVGDSTPDAVRSVAELKATYRLMDMEQVNLHALLAPHQEQTILRASRESRVLLISDTTEIDLTRPQRQVVDAGPLSSESRFGFYLHPLVVYTSTGVPLGIAATHYWTRDQLDTTSTIDEKRKQRNTIPVEEKESYRWVEMVQRGKQISVLNAGTQFVSIADSESDVYEVFAEFESRPDNHHLLVRACQDRAVLELELEIPEQNQIPRRIADALNASDIRYHKTVDVSTRLGNPNRKRVREKPRTARIAELEVRAVTATLRPPPRSGSVKLPPVTLNIVEAREISPPAGEPPIVWVLLTTLPVGSNEEIETVFSDYEKRWLIETYFMTLKSGLGIEKLQYQKLDRYLNAVALLMIVAWRVQLITQAGRIEPDVSCETYFQADQWQPVYLISKPGKKLPLLPPTNGEFLIMVAQLGGYINKKSQGPPGTKTVWRGIQRMETLSQAFKAFGPRQQTCGV